MPWAKSVPRTVHYPTTWATVPAQTRWQKEFLGNTGKYEPPILALVQLYTWKKVAAEASEWQYQNNLGHEPLQIIRSVLLLPVCLRKIWTDNLEHILTIIQDVKTHYYFSLLTTQDFYEMLYLLFSSQRGSLMIAHNTEMAGVSNVINNVWIFIYIAYIA